MSYPLESNNVFKRFVCGPAIDCIVPHDRGGMLYYWHSSLEKSGRQAYWTSWRTSTLPASVLGFFLTYEEHARYGEPTSPLRFL